MTEQFDTYQGFLRAWLLERQRLDRTFSLRRLALQVGMSAGALANVLKGNRHLSEETLGKISRALKLTEKDGDALLALLRMQKTKDPELKLSLLQKLQKNRAKKVHNVEMDQFQAIAEWHHIALLELAMVKGVKVDAEKGSLLLGINLFEARESLQRLERLGLLKRNATGHYVRELQDIQFKSPQANLALSRYHQMMMAKAQEELEVPRPQERYMATQTLAFDPALLGKAEAILDEATQKLVALAKSGENSVELYHLNLVFFNLIKNENRRKSERRSYRGESAQ